MKAAVSGAGDAEFRQALDFVDGMFADSNDALIAFDRELCFQRWTASAASLSKVPPEVAVGGSAALLFPALADHEELACMEQALRGQATMVATSVWSGTRTYYAPLLTRDGKVVGGYAVAKVDPDPQRTSEQLARSNAELERFAYVAAHDLQEPARMVASYMRLVSDKLSISLDDTTRRYLEFALDGALRMRALVDGLLAVARVQSADPTQKQMVSLEEVVAEARSLLSLAIEESAAQLTVSPLPTVRGQRALLVQLFQNLIANAIKYRGAEPPRIEIRCEALGHDECTIHVQDNGVGLPMADAERAFHLLQRVHSRKRYPGSGIGLALCKEVVELHGGQISLTSEVNRGTCVSFTLRS